jgi:hypothetical protein
MDIQLQIGQVSSTIEVSASAPLFQYNYLVPRSDDRKQVHRYFAQYRPRPPWARLFDARCCRLGGQAW